MNPMNWTRALLLCGVLAGAVVLSQVDSTGPSVAVGAEAAAGGTFSGQILLDGEIPKLDPAATDKDPKAADLKACGLTEVPNERLMVNPKSKGIANCFVYMIKAPKDMPEGLKKAKEPVITFDQKGCQFLPHALLVRHDQTVKVLSDDPVGHNTHTHPIRNDQFNSAIKPNERDGVEIKLKVAEKLPLSVKCDIHTWMTAWWLVLDHPYAAVTDAEGNFTITDLPPGDHDFIIWQETSGYIERGKHIIKIDAANKNVKKVVKVPVDKFKL